MRRIRLPSIRFPPIRSGGDGTVNAPPEIVWAILTDYRDGQPRLVSIYYRLITIEQGGKGAGTVLLRPYQREYRRPPEVTSSERAGAWARAAGDE
jgi:hypothetical protein